MEYTNLPLLLAPRDKGESNREYAYRTLRQNIMTVQLQPGQQLSEADLSEQLNMSRTPVHEALMMLKNEWLVDVVPQRGSIVTLINLDYIREGVSMRMMQETHILRLLSGRLTKEQLTQLKENLRRQEELANRGNYEQMGHEFIYEDNEFHRLMYHFANYDRVWDSMHMVTSHYDRIRYLDAALNRTDERPILAEHRIFYDYLLFGIPPGVDLDAEFDKHLGRFRTGFRKITDTLPDYFV